MIQIGVDLKLNAAAMAGTSIVLFHRIIRLRRTLAVRTFLIGRACNVALFADAFNTGATYFFKLTHCQERASTCRTKAPLPRNLTWTYTGPSPRPVPGRIAKEAARQ